MDERGWDLSGTKRDDDLRWPRVRIRHDGVVRGKDSESCSGTLRGDWSRSRCRNEGRSERRSKGRIDSIIPGISRRRQGWRWEDMRLDLWRRRSDRWFWRTGVTGSQLFWLPSEAERLFMRLTSWCNIQTLTGSLPVIVCPPQVVHP